MKVIDLLKIFFGVLASTATLLVLSAAAKAAAEEAEAIEALDNIRQTAEAFAAGLGDPNAVTQVNAAQLDPRLRLAQCGEALEAFTQQLNTRASSRVTVGVRCNNPKRWTLYVPVTLTAFGQALTLTRNLQRGHVISSQDIAAASTDTARLSQGYFISSDEVIGKQVKRPLRSGDILTPNAIESAQVISSGDSVTLLANRGGISVKMRGQALRNGAVGDYIDVKNASSKRVVRGKVTGAGEVEILP